MSRKGRKAAPRILALHQLVLGLLCSPFATQGRSYKGPRVFLRFSGRRVLSLGRHFSRGMHRACGSGLVSRLGCGAAPGSQRRCTNCWGCLAAQSRHKAAPTNGAVQAGAIAVPTVAMQHRQAGACRPVPPITLSAAHRLASATRQSRYPRRFLPLSALQASLPVRPGRCRCG